MSILKNKKLQLLVLLILYLIPIGLVIFHSINMNTTSEIISIFKNEKVYYITMTTFSIFTTLIIFLFHIYIYKILVLVLRPNKEVYFSTLLRLYLLSTLPYSIFSLLILLITFNLSSYYEIVESNVLQGLNLIIISVLFSCLIYYEGLLSRGKVILVFFITLVFSLITFYFNL